MGEQVYREVEEKVGTDENQWRFGGIIILGRRGPINKVTRGNQEHRLDLGFV